MRHLTRMVVRTAIPVTNLQSITGVYNATHQDGIWHFSIDAEAMDSVMMLLAFVLQALGLLGFEKRNIGQV